MEQIKSSEQLLDKNVLLWKLNKCKKKIKKYEDRLQISPYGDDRIDALESTIEFLRHRVDMREWIPVSLKLPYESTVIWTFGELGVQPSLYDPSIKCYRVQGTNFIIPRNKVTHWKSHMPEPPLRGM